MPKLIHTSDWHLGKPFASIADPEKRALVRQARFDALARVADRVREHEAELVVVAGDLFDSPSPDRETVSAAMAAVGAMGVPVYVIPGNHDHAGPGSVWEQAFFARERAQLAPNLEVLLEAEPVEVPGAVLFPAPLAHRQLASDPTAWLRGAEAFADAGDRARIVLAHGSIQGFSSDADEEGLPTGQPNFLDLERLPVDEIDYVALGDWHGRKRVSERAWYSGTPEPDRFPKGEDHRQGQVLVVEARRDAAPEVEVATTGRLGWHVRALTLDSPEELAHAADELAALLAGRARQDLLHLTLEGSLGLEARTALDEHLESLESRLLRLKLRDGVRLAPSREELDALLGAGADPLISNVAQRLVQLMESDPDRGSAAERALRDLHLAAVGG